MKNLMKYGLMFVFSLGLLVHNAEALEKSEVSKKGVEQDGPKIKVLLAKEVRSALLEARGAYRVLNKDGKKLLSFGMTGKRFVAHALSNGLRWGEEFPGIYTITVAPLDPTTCFYVDGLQYKGMLHVYCSTKGNITIVNEVPVEEFVKCTLPLKISSAISREAMAAMVIAARTNAYAKVYYRPETPSLWDISAKEAGYLGLGVTMGKTGVEDAVFATEHIVLEESPGVPLRNVALTPTDAEALASRGLDAKRILRNATPQGEIGTTFPSSGKLVVRR